MSRDLTRPSDLYKFLMSSTLFTLMTYDFSIARINCHQTHWRIQNITFKAMDLQILEYLFDDDSI